jgi:hypothetical protein
MKGEVDCERHLEELIGLASWLEMMSFSTWKSKKRHWFWEEKHSRSLESGCCGMPRGMANRQLTLQTCRQERKSSVISALYLKCSLIAFLVSYNCFLTSKPDKTVFL